MAYLLFWSSQSYVKNRPQSNAFKYTSTWLFYVKNKMAENTSTKALFCRSQVRHRTKPSILTVSPQESRSRNEKSFQR